MLATIATCGLNTYVGVSVDPVVGLLTFSASGQPLGSVNITPGQTWYYAATVSGTPGDLAWWANAGQSPMRSPDPASGGWW